MGAKKYQLTLEVSAREHQEIVQMLRKRHLSTQGEKPVIYGYARVSHYDSAESGLSIEDQIASIERWMDVLQAEEELTRGNIFKDEGQSALKKRMIQVLGSSPPFAPAIMSSSSASTGASVAWRTSAAR